MVTSTPLVFVRRLSLDDIVDELLVSFHRDDDRPAEHVCRPTRDGWCTHHLYDHRPLFARLQELVMPGQSMVRDGGGGKSGKAPAGSPAPWSSPPAELLDEIRRGALSLVAQARLLLGFGPLHLDYLDAHLVRRWVPAAQCSLDVAGAAALNALPDLLEAMQRQAELARDPLVAAADLRTGEFTAPGLVEKRLRGWHRAALVLTGHELKWAKLGQVANPNNPSMWPEATSGWMAGPMCSVVGCGHQTCTILRRGRREKWVEARCPHCDSASLRQDPLTGDVVCLRPSCTDVEGRRHSWPVDELERLGVIIVREASA